jgi:hypothetical protein
MSRFHVYVYLTALVCACAAVPAHASDYHNRDLAVVMTNGDAANTLKVYDARSGELLQELSTRGKGGAGNNARGVRQFEGRLVAAVNYGSNSVAIFRRDGNRLRFGGLVNTSSPPLSIDFGNGHMYVAGTTTVDSFPMHNGQIGFPDGTATLQLAGGGVPPDGSTAQVGVLGKSQLLVTLKSPDPGTVDIVTLRNGAIDGHDPLAVATAPGSLTPFGFVVNPDGTALITLAHSDENALFRDGTFGAVTAAQQGAPCWMTRVGQYVFVANTGSRSISRLVGTGSHVFVDSTIAARTPGAAADLDAANGVLAVIDHGNGESHVSLFAYNRFGELAVAAPTVTVGVPNANGIAVLAAR